MLQRTINIMLIQQREVNMWNRIKNWWAQFNMSPEEKWLSDSVDIIELESRLRVLENQGWRMGNSALRLNH